MNKITLEEFRSLKDYNIERSIYDTIHCKIIDRIDYILTLCCSKINYWDLSDDNYGCFDSYDESDNIVLKNNYGEFKLYSPLECIPVRWLWEDFEEEFMLMMLSTKLNKIQIEILMNRNGDKI